MGDGTTVVLEHHRVRLAVHRLRPPLGGADGTWPLLLLHGLGEQAPGAPPGEASAWPGAVWGLDFTGHGASSLPRGGGYTCELLLADVDVALGHLGPATLLGRGVGAYVALLAAGARPGLVRGAVLVDGPGLAGGAGPGTAPVVAPAEGDGGPPDPYALLELSGDVRSPAYAASFARAAVRAPGGASSLVVAVGPGARPPWLVAVAAEAGVVTGSPSAALADFAAARWSPPA